MSSDFVHGDRSPIPPDILPQIQGSLSNLVGENAINEASRHGSQRNQCPPLNSLGERANYEDSSLEFQSKHGNQMEMVGDLTSVSVKLGAFSQNIGIRPQGSFQNQASEGNRQWRPRPLDNQVFPSIGNGIVRSDESNGNPNGGISSPIMGICHNQGMEGYSETNNEENYHSFVNASNKAVIDINLEFPPLPSNGSGNAQGNGIEVGQSSNGRVERGANDGRQAQNVPIWEAMQRSRENQRKSWSSILSNESNRYNIEKKIMNKDNDVLLIPEDVLQRGSNQWNKVVVGFFFDNRLGFKYVDSFLRRRWKLKGRLNINADKEFFYLRFSNDDDRKMVLEEGPIFIYEKVFILREWSIDVDLEKRGCKTLPSWARFWDVPKFLWNKEGFSYLASSIGDPLFTDRMTMEMKRLGYARMCVVVDTNFEFPSKLKFRSGLREFEVDVEYQWIPPKCKNCCSFGHFMHNCREEKRKEVTSDKNKNVENVIEVSQNNKENEQSVTEVIHNETVAAETETIQDKMAEKERTVAAHGRTEEVQDRNETVQEITKVHDSNGENETEISQAEKVDIVEKAQEEVTTEEGRYVETVGGRITMGNNSEHIQQNNSNVEVTLATKGTSTAKKQKKTIEENGITRPEEENHTSIDINLEADRNENRGGGRRIIARYEVVHTQKERDNRGRTRSGVVLQNNNTYSLLNQKENEESNISFNGDIEEFDEDGSSQPDEDGIPFLNGVPNILKSYSASKEKGAKVKNQNSASKVKGINANKQQKAMVTPVKEPTNVRNIAIRGKGHNQRR